MDVCPVKLSFWKLAFLEIKTANQAATHQLSLKSWRSKRRGRRKQKTTTNSKAPKVNADISSSLFNLRRLWRQGSAPFTDGAADKFWVENSCQWTMMVVTSLHSCCQPADDTSGPRMPTVLFQFRFSKVLNNRWLDSVSHANFHKLLFCCNFAFAQFY